MSSIGLLLPDVHVSNRNHTNEFAPHGERGKQAPARPGPAESVVSPFPLRVPDVAPDDQGFIEEQILRFFGRDTVPLPVLLDIAIIPVEPDTALQRVSLAHISQYISDIYIPGEIEKPGQSVVWYDRLRLEALMPIDL